MCEDCDAEPLYQSYAHKRALISKHWRPARNRIYVATAVEPIKADDATSKEKRAQS
jgi:hypothetical protein